MSRWTARRERFRALMSGAGCVFPASVFDPISARIAEDLGFEAGMFAGSVASMAVLGAPDLIVLTLSEFAGQAHRICRASSLPLMVDADHGYGNALNVMRTVEALETAGVCGLSIEDTDLPQRGGGGPRLIPLAEGMGKVRAALAARADPGLVVAGRTGAAAISGIDDALARARAYADAGADAIFLTGLRSHAELEAAAAALDGVPLIVGGMGGAAAGRARLASLGVRLCLTGHQPFAAAVEAVRQTLAALRDGARPADLEGVASPETMARVTRAADYERRIRDFL